MAKQSIPTDIAHEARTAGQLAGKAQSQLFAIVSLADDIHSAVLEISPAAHGMPQIADAALHKLCDRSNALLTLVETLRVMSEDWRGIETYRAGVDRQPVNGADGANIAKGSDATTDEFVSLVVMANLSDRLQAMQIRKTKGVTAAVDFLRECKLTAEDYDSPEDEADDEDSDPASSVPEAQPFGEHARLELDDVRAILYEIEEIAAIAPEAARRCSTDTIFSAIGRLAQDGCERMNELHDPLQKVLEGAR